MYADKHCHYAKKGVDRRGILAAHTALCKIYTKIIKINLTNDTYSIINMDVAEQTREMGFADTMSEWFSGFGKTGQVHPDDMENYTQKTILIF